MKYAWLSGALFLVLAMVVPKTLYHGTLPPRVFILPAQLIADGRDTATLTIDEPSPVPPRITIQPPQAATVQQISATAHGWQAQLRSGVMPGIVEVRVELLGRPPALARLITNSHEAGTPMRR